MAKLRWILLRALVFTLMGGTVSATELGDPAPLPKIGKWIKGEAVDFEKNRGEKIFVIEFWATWCPPCKVTIPHMNKLQSKYRDKGIVIIGITDEEADRVRKFVKEKGNRMGYAVAIDEEEKTARAYMKAFGVEGIPHAFVIDKEGRIAWAGHPMEGLDKALEEIVAGRYDLEEKVRVACARKLVPVYTYLSKETNEHELARVIGDKIYALGKGDAKLLNGLAWFILTTDGIRKRDVVFALRAVQRAYALCGGKNSSVADTYARVLFEMGKTEEAIKYQKKAISLCQDKALLDTLKKRLKTYKERLTT